MNKPVAWMQTLENQAGKLKRTVNIEQIGKQDIPLYTNPVKELTDEEIDDIAQQCWVYPQGEQAIFNQHKFAKAILRKAQEK